MEKEDGKGCKQERWKPQGLIGPWGGRGGTAGLQRLMCVSTEKLPRSNKRTGKTQNEGKRSAQMEIFQQVGCLCVLRG